MRFTLTLDTPLSKPIPGVDLDLAQFFLPRLNEISTKKNKADSIVLEKVRVVQAMFLAAETGRGPLVDQAKNLYKRPVVHSNSQDNQN